MSYYCYILFIPMVLLTNLLIFITNSWFSMWMIMEINLISLISLIMFDINIKSETLINYFLIQAFNSYLFMLSMFLLNFNIMYNLMLLIMNLSMLTKLGMPPFFMWYLKIINNLNWMNIFLMMTIQKIIPLMILNWIMINKFSMIMNMIMLMLSGIYSSIKGLSQINLKIIFSYSSIIQLTWIILLMLFNEMLMLIYLMIYSIIMLNLIMLFNYYNIKNIINMNMIKMNNLINYYLMNFSIFSLASLPPMFGFIMKMMMMQFLSNLLPILLLMMMLMNSLISIFFYLRLLFNSIMINSVSNKLNFKFINYYNNYKYNIIILSWFTMTMLMVFELI